MPTENSENQRLIKVTWQDVRARVANVAPVFAKIVDELAPDKSLPLYLAYYPYGAIVGDTRHLYLPDKHNGFFRLSDKDAPADIIKHLGYGMDSSPMGMVLDKNVEVFVDLKEEEIVMPWVIYTPGSFISFARTLSRKSGHNYMPNDVLTAASGARSTFMLPNIGCITNHSKLQRDFNIQTPPPKSLYSHWELFKEIINSDDITCNWQSCIMFFSEKWIDKLHNDKSWLPLKEYLYEFTWYYFEFERNRAYYDIFFSMVQKNRNLKPNPYLVDTAQHLFKIALGAAPGYSLASTDDFLPASLLEQVFVNSYGLKKYFPNIMHPALFNFEKSKHPIYYSLQHPSTQVFSPKSRKVSSTLFEMRELEHIMRVFIKELLQDNAMCSDTILSKIAKNVEFRYYHNEADRHHIVRPSSEIALKDKRFGQINPTNITPGAKFASDARFLRGCISMEVKT